MLFDLVPHLDLVLHHQKQVHIHEAFKLQLGHHLSRGDFEELYPVGSPEYEKAIQRMIEDRLRASFDALEDVKLMRAYKKSSERIKG